MTALNSRLVAEAPADEEVSTSDIGLQQPVRPGRYVDLSQAWVKVSIAEAARMSVESVRIVARSKAICLRLKRGDAPEGT